MERLISLASWGRVAATDRKNRMQRNIVIALAALVLLLAIALAYVVLRGQSGGQGAPPPLSVNAAEENVAEPLHDEMDCIDRLLQNNDLNANEVGPALARCQGGTTGNQSNGQ